MSNPVSSMVNDYVVQALRDCGSYLDASAVKEFMRKDGPRPSVPANKLVFSINVPCAVAKLSSKSFHKEVAHAVYNMIKSVPFLKLSHKYQGSETDVVGSMADHLGEILSREAVEACVKAHNTQQVTLTAQGGWGSLTQPIDCQLTRTSLCLACPKKLASMYEADLNKMSPGGKTSKGNGQSYWWVLWLILLILVGIGVWMWFNRKNKKEKQAGAYHSVKK